jgi:hypothetical protein
MTPRVNTLGGHTHARAAATGEKIGKIQPPIVGIQWMLNIKMELSSHLLFGRNLFIVRRRRFMSYKKSLFLSFAFYLRARIMRHLAALFLLCMMDLLLFQECAKVPPDL